MEDLVERLDRVLEWRRWGTALCQERTLEMSTKRNLHDELIEGIDTMRQQRQGWTSLRTQEVEETSPLEVDTEQIHEIEEGPK